VVTRIGIRELRQHASRYIDMVKAGEAVEVTDRGELVALLVPPTRGQAALDRLIGAGRVIAAAGPFELPTPIVLPPGEASASETLRELREERLP
jgi:prevent-host-death family protein